MSLYAKGYREFDSGYTTPGLVLLMYAVGVSKLDTSAAFAEFILRAKAYKQVVGFDMFGIPDDEAALQQARTLEVNAPAMSRSQFKNAMGLLALKKLDVSL